MDYSHLPDVRKFVNPDDCIRAFLFPTQGKKRVGKLRHFRRLAASCGITDVMKKGRDDIILEIASRIGWREIYEKALENVGIPKIRFLELGITESNFHDMLTCGVIHKAGKYRYTFSGKSSYSVCYNIYDYFELKKQLGSLM